jgi:hypothetical protein
VDAETSQEEVRTLKAVFEPYKKANDNLALIHSAMDRSLKGLEDLTIKQLEAKVKLFDEETKEHLKLLETAVGKIQLHEMKFAMERIIKAETRKVLVRHDELENTIWWWRARERAINVGLAVAALCFFLFLLRLMF